MVYLFSCWTAASTRFIGGNAVGLWGWLIVGLWLAYGWLMGVLQARKRGLPKASRDVLVASGGLLFGFPVASRGLLPAS